MTTSSDRPVDDRFEVSLDDKARRWLEEHSSSDALVIAYTDARC